LYSRHTYGVRITYIINIIAIHHPRIQNHLNAVPSLSSVRPFSSLSGDLSQTRFGRCRALPSRHLTAKQWTGRRVRTQPPERERRRRPRLARIWTRAGPPEERVPSAFGGNQALGRRGADSEVHGQGTTTRWHNSMTADVAAVVVVGRRHGQIRRGQGWDNAGPVRSRRCTRWYDTGRGSPAARRDNGNPHGACATAVAGFDAVQAILPLRPRSRERTRSQVRRAEPGRSVRIDGAIFVLRATATDSSSPCGDRCRAEGPGMELRIRNNWFWIGCTLSIGS
ncbi:unnamed protein product, partial [Urochloa humidicola]